jgi:subtilase family serine protease
MRLYKVDGKTHFAMAAAPSVPTELADVVLGIRGTHDFYPQHAPAQVTPVTKPLPQATCPTGDQDCSGNGLGPQDWSAVYDVNPVYKSGFTGKGVSIAIVGISQIAQSDINAFRTKFGLPASTVTMKPVPNTGTPAADNGAGVEAILDTEWSGGIGKGANIIYTYVGANDPNVNDAVAYAVEQNLAPILSESFGGCEQGETPSDADLLDIIASSANLLGITYIAASGDFGAAGCGTADLYVDSPASFPSVTAVGGTEFPTGSLKYSGGIATGYSTAEEVWNENNGNGQAGGGGGISVVFARPSYQSAIPTCTVHGKLPVTGITASAMREVPDIALAAAGVNNGYFIDCTFDGQDCAQTGGTPTILEIGGTSAAAPSFAGVVALLEQAAGGRRLGNVNPLLYALNASNPTAFHDITVGNNELTCSASFFGVSCSQGTNGYTAAKGYDCATGLGSLDVNNLVTAWKALTPTSTILSATPTATSEGAKVALKATVDVTATNANALGGTVTFAFQSYLANGAKDLSWTLASANITGGTATSGTATDSVVIPPGLVNPKAQAVDVYAMYGGDKHHLPSTSAKVHVTFSPVSLCVVPTTDKVATGASFKIVGEHGASPYEYFIDSDGTCDSSGANCSTLNQTTGAFVAGTGSAGYVLVSVFDHDGAETFSEITVGAATGTPPWATGSGIVTAACSTAKDAGVDSGHHDASADSGHDASVDAGKGAQ